MMTPDEGIELGWDDLVPSCDFCRLLDFGIRMEFVLVVSTDKIENFGKSSSSFLFIIINLYKKKKNQSKLLASRNYSHTL